MRGFGFDVPRGGLSAADLGQVHAQIARCTDRAVPFILYYDGQQVACTVADASESLEVLCAFAGFRPIQ
jgi:hypothetical protein